MATIYRRMIEDCGRQEDSFAAAVVTCSNNNNTTVDYLPQIQPLWHFLTHGGEIERQVTRRWQHSPLIEGRLEIPCYIMLHGKKKLVAWARNDMHEKILPVRSIRMVMNSFIPWIRAD